MAQVTIATGFDVDYYLEQVGVDYYLTAAGEPPGLWAGQGAQALGLSGQVGPDAEPARRRCAALYHYDIGPDGTPLATPQRRPKYPATAPPTPQVQEAIDKRIGRARPVRARRKRSGTSGCRSGPRCGPGPRSTT